MNDSTYIMQRTLEHKIAIAENNGNNALIVTLDVLKEILAMLKEQEAAYHGAEELLQQKTILFDDAIKRLKEQEAVTIKKTKEPYGCGVYGGICPKCCNWIQSAHSFCGFCGQAVKWE